MYKCMYVHIYLCIYAWRCVSKDFLTQDQHGGGGNEDEPAHQSNNESTILSDHRTWIIKQEKQIWCVCVCVCVCVCRLTAPSGLYVCMHVCMHVCTQWWIQCYRYAIDMPWHSQPEKNPGENMAKKCSSMTKAVASKEYPLFSISTLTLLWKYIAHR